MIATLALPTAKGDGMAQNSSGAPGVTGSKVQGALPPQGVTPYSADSMTENTQILNDGNRITHKSVARVYQDSEGRTRREQTIESHVQSMSAPSGDAFQFIDITDPVAGAHYHLDSRSKIAQRTLFPSRSTRSRAALPSSGSASQMPSGSVQQFSSGPRGPMETHSTTESLGTQMMEGLEGQGARTTAIPAGAVGNERPIETVSEVWFSPALHNAVLTKRVDPRIGELVTRLTNIHFEEPDPALFQIPPEYTVQDQPARVPVP